MFDFRKKKSSSSIFVIQHKDAFRLQRKNLSDTFDTAYEYISDDLQSHIRSVCSTLSKKRIWIGFSIFYLIFFIFLGRAFYLQGYRGAYYHEIADANRYRTTRVLSPRGKILDRNDVVLATNVPAFILTMTIADLPKDQAKRNNVINHVCKISGIQRADIDLLLTQYIKQPEEQIPLVRNIPYESAMRLTIELAQDTGFDLVASVQRSYPTSSVSLSHVLGYLGKISPEESLKQTVFGYRPIDQIGKVGVEQTEETFLRGIPGNVVTEVNASGRELSVISKKDPISGSDVRLSIDVEFQKYIESQLQLILNTVQATRGSVVAMDPNSGEIRAIVSLPAFDNNIFSGQLPQDEYQKLIQDPDQPLFFRAISGEYPSGSIFKPFVAYSALAEQIISEHTSFISSGGIRVGEWFFPDWKAGGHGITDVRKAIAESVNTFFYVIGGGFHETIGLGVERITNYAKQFGFGNVTGIDLPNEANGFLPTKEWKEQTKGERWYVGDTYHLAIGQGDFLTTPLQMAAATAMLANGGFRVAPHLVIRDASFEKKQMDALNKNALRIVQEGMKQSVLSGSNRRLQSLPYPVAGKTGTAQAGEGKATHSWFTGYGPYSSPEIVLTILVEEGGESTSAAVPLAEHVFSWWFKQKKNETIDLDTITHRP